MAPVSRNLLAAGLTGWIVPDRYEFEQHGPVEYGGGVLRLGRGKPATGIQYRGPLPQGAYEVRIEARRVDGSDFFSSLTFPVRDSHLSLIIGGWGGGVTGLSNLDGMSAVENETTGYTPFENGRWYRIRLAVSPERIQTWLDDESIIDVDIEDRKLSIWWEQEPLRPLGINTWHSAAEIRRLELREVAGA